MAKNKKNLPKENTQVVATEISEKKPFEISNTNVFLILAGIVGLCYVKIWQNDLVWDDKQYIFFNDIVKNFDLKGIFTTFQVGNYHPITMLSLAIDYALVKDKLWLYHFENLLFHILNSYLVFTLFKKLNQTTLLAFFVAILFALHPIHVESVAWKAERKDLLYTLFLLLSFHKYLDYNKTASLKDYAISIILFVLACLSKGMAVVLPALLLITDVAFLGKRLNFSILKDKIVYFVLTIIFSYITILAQKESNAIVNFVGEYYNPFEKVILVSYSFVFYWVKSVFPINLIPFYPYPSKPIPYYYYLAFVLALGFAFVVFKYWKKYPRLIWGILFSLISLSTILQIITVGSAITADRYSYLASIGIFYVFGLIISELWNRQAFIRWIFFITCFMFGILTFLQVATWKNPKTLFSRALELHPKQPNINYNIGFYYINEKDYKTARKHFNVAIDNGLNDPAVFRTLAGVYLDEGDNDNALEMLNKIGKKNTYINQDYWLYGTAFYRKKDYTNAIKNFKIASEKEPKNLDYLKDYGKALMDGKQLQAAINAFEKVYENKPKDTDYYQLMGNCYIKTTDWLKGIEYWKKGTVRDSTGNFEYNIGIQYALHGDLATTREWYIKAARKGQQGAIEILKKNGDKF